VHGSRVLVALPDRRDARSGHVAALLAVLRDAGLTLHEEGDEERIPWSELLGAP